MNTTEKLPVVIEHDDMQVVAEAMMLRLQLRGSEARRIERMRQLLTTASDLCRALSAHTHHALVNCQGSHGTWDLERDTRELHDAFAAYGSLVRDIAREYRAVAREAAVPADFETQGASPRATPMSEVRRVVA